MVKTIEYRTSAAQWDGGLPFVAGSPVMSLSTAAANQGEIASPTAGTIVQALLNILQAPDGAAAAVNIGIRGDADYFLTSGYSVATTAAVEVIDITASLTNTAVTKGQVLSFDTDGAATATGLVAVTLVISPNA